MTRMHSSITRREAIASGLRALVVLPAAAAFGCGGRTDCTDTSGLAPADAQARTDQNYLDTSADPAKACEICEQYVPPEKSGCGSCKVLKGGVNPKGSCNLFVRKV